MLVIIRNIALLAFMLAGLPVQSLGNAKIELVKKPTNVTIKAGQDTELHCKFNIRVQCNWLKSGSIESISGRFRYMYIYTSAQEGGNTYDCSIKITNVNQEDHGPWICTFKETLSEESSEEIPIQSSPVFVNIEENVEDTEIKTSTVRGFRSDEFTGVGNLDFSKLESAWISMACLVSILLILTITNTIILAITCYRSSKSKSHSTDHCKVTEKPGPITSLEDNYRVMKKNEVYESTYQQIL